MSRTNNIIDKILHWGIIGTGEIANIFAKDMATHCKSSVLSAVLSRNLNKAKSFGREYGIPEDNCFDNFEDFSKNNIDVCYIATPHACHPTDAYKCLMSEMHVLIEKPMTLKKLDAENIFKLAKEKNRFAMEAIWSRFIPAIKNIEKIIKSRMIGQISSLDVHFAFDGKQSPSRLTNPDLGGGSLYDIGIYALQLVTMCIDNEFREMKPIVLYKDKEIISANVDKTFRAEKDVLLTFRTSISEKGNSSAFIRGTRGDIWIQPPFHCPYKFYLNNELFEFKVNGHGLHYQVQEVENCILKGTLESDTVPWKETLNWVETLEELGCN